MEKRINNNLKIPGFLMLVMLICLTPACDNSDTVDPPGATGGPGGSPGDGDGDGDGDPGSNGESLILSTTLGQLDKQNFIIFDIEFGTTAGQLESALTVEDNVSVVIRNVSGDSVVSADYLADGFSVVVGLSGDTQEFSVEMEELQNTSVFLIEGVEVRIPTDFFENGPGEWIILDDSEDSEGSHFWMSAGIESGSYTSHDFFGDPQAPYHFDFDAINFGPLTGFYSTYDTGSEFALTIDNDSIRGMANGHLDTGGGDPLVEFTLWFHSDRTN